MRAALINSEAITIHGWGMYLSRQGCHPLSPHPPAGGEIEKEAKDYIFMYRGKWILRDYESVKS